MLVSDFDFDLPEELIAKEPLADRAASRMLHVRRTTGSYEDRMFREFPSLLRAGDLVVFNNTRVFPARLFGRRGGLHAQALSDKNPAMRDFLRGKTEVLLAKRVLQQDDSQVWEALVRPGRKIDVGEHLFFGDNELEAEVIGRGEYGERTLRFAPLNDFFGTVERLGHVPLPPYIGRDDRPEDRERYQTVYAREQGSVAAPTAGLHFTPAILEALRASDIETAEVTLHVGLGTFQPVHAEVVEEHKLHREWYSISQAAATSINQAIRDHRRVVTIGTTSVRTLEYAASIAGQENGCNCVRAGSGEADIFIYPGFQFRIVSAMLTNFHLPKSTLIMLVSAFAGREHVLQAYRHAVEEKYRFYSYGDCMFLE